MSNVKTEEDFAIYNYYHGHVNNARNLESHKLNTKNKLNQQSLGVYVLCKMCD